MSDKVTDLIIGAVRDIVAQEGIETGGELGADTRLFGDGGLLDSMALVSLVVAVEQLIDEQLGVAVALADEKALSQRNSPYRTIGALAAYASQEISARGGHA